MISKQIGKLYKREERRVKKKGKRKKKRRIEVMVGKKRLFCRYNFGKLFQIGHGNAFKIYGTIYTPTSIPVTVSSRGLSHFLHLVVTTLIYLLFKTSMGWMNIIIYTFLHSYLFM